MKKWILIIVLMLSGYICQAGELSVTWTMPTTNHDGTPLTDLGGAKIYWGLNSSNYTHVVDAGLTNRLDFTNLTAGVLYYLNGTAYSIAGLESAFTVEVAKKAYKHEDKPKEPIHLMIRSK